jgi:uncharacterized protein YukE
MGFSASGYQAVIDKIIHELGEVNKGVEHVRDVVNNSILSHIPLIGDGLKWLWNKFIGLINQVVSKIQELLKPFAVPTLMDQYANEWLKIHKTASNVSSTIEDQVETHGKDTWKGLAGGAYQNGVSHQAPSANAIAGMANTISGACTAIRNYGYGFYIAIGVVIAGLVVAIFTVETVVGAIAGVVTALIATGAACATLYLGVDSQSKTLQGQLGANSSFPGNKWPQATTS